MNVTGFIQKVLDSQRKIRAGYEKMLEGLPEGKLEAFTVKGRIYYRRRINGRREYVGSESELIVSQLKLRAFLEEAIEILRINEDAACRFVREFRAPDPESVIKALPPACRFADTSVLTNLGIIEKKRVGKSRLRQMHSQPGRADSYRP